MLPIILWIVYASNFDLNIPECHMTDSSLSLCKFDSWSTVSRHGTINELISICITDPYSCVRAIYLSLCICVLVHACVCVHTSVYICTCEFKFPIEYHKIYHSSGTFDTHSGLVIFDEHLVW